MMRLIDADELGYTLTEGLKCALCINPMHTDRGCDGNCRIPNPLLLNALEKYIADGINNQKTIDAVTVVRCNECKFAYAMDTDEFETFYFCEYADRSNAVDPMDFCSEGEKK